MKSIIVGTAGHIDHGKTALVRALTGIDADRLAEEKRRGITIDLGFAHLDLPVSNGEALRLGFVDVPGHERFVRNMLAGAGGIDLVLLVIATDESIKPQTREHFDILQLLGVQHGITVLTKSDAVDADTLEVVRLEVEEFLRGTFIETPKSPIVAVSSLTGAGLPELQQEIVKAAAQVKARDRHALPRLPIDRVFTMKGFGTVVTGTLLSGTIHVEDELEVFPENRVVRVRGIQVHSESVASAVAGQRTALNLAGASTEDLARGMTLAAPNTFLETRRADVQLTLLSSAPRALKNGARVHFHSNTMETVAELILHNEKQVAPGASVFARIKLPAPALLLPGDRFIIRQFSPLITIGGGVVLDPAPMKRALDLANFLTLLATRPLNEIVAARIARQRTAGISMASLIAETGKTQNVIEQALSASLRSGKISHIGALFMDTPVVQTLKTDLVSAVRQFHSRNPLVPGVNREQLREQQKISSPTFSALVDDLVKNRQLEIVEDVLRLPGHGIVMKDDEAESRKKIEDAFATAGLKVPALYEVIAGLKIDKTRAQKIVTLLLREKVLIKIADDLVFHQKALVLLRQQIAAFKTKSPKIDVAQFKELTGVSRKYAIPLLEHLDRERVTKRVGDAREIL
jgi:selenocysteine-specific elongation factor